MASTIASSRIESVFGRAIAKKDIIGDRKILPVYKFSDIAPAHEDRKANEVVVIQPGVEIIPGEQSARSEYYSAQNFLKRGPLVEIPTFVAEEMIAREWSDLKARIFASEDPKHSRSKRYAGWLWYEPDMKTAHILHPSTVMEGHRLFIASNQSDSLKDKIDIRDEPYRAKESPLLTARAKIPARHGDELKYPVTLEHVARHDDIRRFVEWTRIRSRHECALKGADFSFRFKDYVTYCPHDVAAYDAYSAQVGKKEKVVIPQPFPLPSEPMMRLYLSLLYDTMQIVVKKGSAREKQVFRPLSLAQTNPVLMDAWLNPDYTNRMTFYLHKPVRGYKRMSEFNIAPSAAGLPFRDPEQ